MVVCKRISDIGSVHCLYYFIKPFGCQSPSCFLMIRRGEFGRDA